MKRPSDQITADYDVHDIVARMNEYADKLEADVAKLREALGAVGKRHPCEDCNLMIAHVLHDTKPVQS